ncbi:MAG: molybdopterin-dependent oxidoreductase [Verrucomicrobiales bacterium]|nr:molybdopterin-dependent oxidoreductase [Verrucomicrobiales bacterium]
MRPHPTTDETLKVHAAHTTDPGEIGTPMNRRSFVQVLGAGWVIAVSLATAFGQSRGGRGGTRPVSTRLHIGQDGTITVLTGKIEMGQGARTQLTRAAAEGASLDQVRLVMMGDTEPGAYDDGITAGSGPPKPCRRPSGGARRGASF